MISAFVRLFALRPFLSMAILGVPVFTLIVVGFFAIWAVKLLFFVVLPIVLVVWLVRKVTRSKAPVAPVQPIDPVI